MVWMEKQTSRHWTPYAAEVKFISKIKARLPSPSQRDQEAAEERKWSSQDILERGSTNPGARAELPGWKARQQRSTAWLQSPPGWLGKKGLRWQDWGLKPSDYRHLPFSGISG